MAIAAVAGLASLGGAMIAAGTFAITFGAAVGAFALGAGLSMVSRALAPKPNLGAQMRGITQTSREPAGSRKIVYGKMRVGGQVVFISNSGDDNKYLHMAIAFASHEIQSYDEIWFNDKKVWTSSGGFQDDWGTYVTIDRKTGTDGQAASTDLVNANVLWTSNHKLSGIAYVAFRLEWDTDKFPQGVPNITAVIRGKKVYDPRSNVYAYSDNPALCLRDYMIDQKYGLGEVVANIDSTSLNAAANLCEEQVTLDAGGTQDRYRCNGVIETGNQIRANIEQLLASMGGMLTYSGGKYFIDGAEYKTPTLTFTEADVISDIQTQTKQSRRGIYNGVKGIFVSEEKNYKVLDYPPQISSTYATEDGDPIYLDMALPFVTNNTQAQRLAKIALLKSRQQVVINMTVNLKGLQVKIGDTINVTNDRLNYSSKVFQVIDYSLAIADGGALAVNLACIETAAAIYDWTTSDEEDFLSGGELDLYDGRTVANVTNLAMTEIGLLGPDGGVSSSVQLSWTPVTDAFVELYKIRYNKYGTTDYFYASTREPRIFISGLEIGSNYDFRVQAENLIGVSSTGTTLANQTLDGDTSAPAVPTSLATTGGIRAITATWTNPSDIDLKQIEVHVVASNTTPADSATPEAVINGDEYVYPTGSASPVTKYFFLRAVDYSGNKSAYTSGVAGTSLQVTSEDVGAGEIEGKTLALLLNKRADGFVNVGEGSLVGVNVDGTVKLDSDGFVLYNGSQITIEHDQQDNYTFLTQVGGKRGFVAFDINKTAPFDLPIWGDKNCAFVWSDNDQFYYDINQTVGGSPAFTAFDPSSFTGSTTGTDGTTDAHIVALGAVETGAVDTIISGGLYPEPIDLITTQIPDDVITGRTIVVNSITANKISGDISEVFSFGLYNATSTTLSSSFVTFGQFTTPAPDADINKYATLHAHFGVTAQSPNSAFTVEVDIERKSKGLATGVSIGSVVASGPFAQGARYLEIAGNLLTTIDLFGGISTTQTSATSVYNVVSIEYQPTTDRTKIIYASSDVISAGTTVYYNQDKWTSSGDWITYAAVAPRYGIIDVTTLTHHTIFQPLARSNAEETYRIRAKTHGFSGTSVTMAVGIAGQIQLLT